MSKVRKRKWKTRLGEIKEAWVVDYSDIEGERHIRTFQRKKDADEYLLTVGGEVRDGTHIAPSKSETVAKAADRWINRVEANGMRGTGPAERTTIRQYRQHVDLHIVPRIGSIKLAHLTATRVERFRDDLLGSISRPLARKVMTSFKSMLKAAKRGHLAADASIGSDKRGERKLEIGRDIPTPEEIKRLIHAAASADIKRRTLLLVATFTGLRASELRGLRWVDVDLKHGNVHVRQRADRYCEIGPPKSASSVRTIKVDALVVNALKEWKLACPKGEGGLVFPTAKGEVEHHANMLRNSRRY